MSAVAISDVLLINVAFLLAYYLRYRLQLFRQVDPAFDNPPEVFVPFQIVLTALLLIAFKIDGVYEPARVAAAEPAVGDYAAMGEKQVAKEIKRLEKLMFDHARNLEFERAAQVRDQLAALRERVFGASAGSNVVALAGERAA